MGHAGMSDSLSFRIVSYLAKNSVRVSSGYLAVALHSGGLYESTRRQLQRELDRLCPITIKSQPNGNGYLYRHPETPEDAPIADLPNGRPKKPVV